MTKAPPSRSMVSRLRAAALIMIALLAAFFVGRGSGLSNEVIVGPSWDTLVIDDAGLDRFVPGWWSAKTLESTVEEIRRRASVDIQVDWDELRTLGVERSTPVNQALEFGTVWYQLTTVFRGANSKICISFDDTTIYVSSSASAAAREARQRPIVRIYDIADLVSSVDDTDGLMASVHLLVRDTVTSDQWRENGGTLGSIRVFDTRLVVIQTPSAHRQIVRLLEQLRETRSGLGTQQRKRVP